MYVFYIIYKWTLRGNILLWTILQFLNYQIEKAIIDNQEEEYYSITTTNICHYNCSYHILLNALHFLSYLYVHVAWLKKKKSLYIRREELRVIVG